MAKRHRLIVECSFKIKFYREDDGRWIADIPALPGVTAYGKTRKQAIIAADILALRVIADHLEALK